MKIGFVIDDGTFSAGSAAIVGRQVANAGLLKSLVHYGASNSFAAFGNPDINHALPSILAANFVHHQHRSLEELLHWADIAFVPSPILSSTSTARRRCGIAADQCKIVGLTHALHTAKVKREFSHSYPTLASTDAIVCTSAAARHAVTNLRGSSTPRGPMALSIPLGIDTSTLPSVECRELVRHEARRKINVDSQVLSLLYLGRIDYTSKSHFVSLFRFAERLAICTGRRVTLLLVGWFPSSLMARQVLSAAPNLAPSVKIKHLDGRRPDVKWNALLAADACLAPTDNIQESFGIVPLEAMRSGLPLALSDWNGYRDTIQGCNSVVSMKTTYPWAPVAETLHVLHGDDRIDDVRLIASLACLTAVDHIRGAENLAALLSNPSKIERAAADTAANIAERFDWGAVAIDYLEKFDSLLHGSTAADNFIPFTLNLGNPFCHFASEALTDETVVFTDETEIASIAQFALCSDSLRVLPADIFSPLVLQEVYQRLRKERRVRVGKLLAPGELTKNIKITCAVSVLLKWGLLRTT